MMITREEAVTLLEVTASHMPDGIIAGPHSVVGYTLSGAIRILGRCQTFWVDDGLLSADLPGHGTHVWTLRLKPQPDPWGHPAKA